MYEAERYLQKEINRAKIMPMLLLILDGLLFYLAYNFSFYLMPLAMTLLLPTVLKTIRSINQIKDYVHFRNLLQHEKCLEYLETERKTNQELGDKIEKDSAMSLRYGRSGTSQAYKRKVHEEVYITKKENVLKKVIELVKQTKTTS